MNKNKNENDYKNCDNCDYDSIFMTNEEMIVCKDCFNSEPYSLVTQTNALKEYPITKKDLLNIRRIKYKGMFTTYLFLIKDIHNICIQKYGSEAEYKKIKATKKNKQKEKQDLKKHLQKQRTTELANYLKSIKLYIREDSTLCYNYIQKGEKGGFTKEQIGEIMLEMKFLYEKTNYANILRSLRREYRSYCFRRWTDNDEEMIRQLAKQQVLENTTFDDNKLPKKLLELKNSLN